MLSVTPICPILWLPQQHLIAPGHVQTRCIEQFLLGWDFARLMLHKDRDKGHYSGGKAMVYMINFGVQAEFFFLFFSLTI